MLAKGFNPKGAVRIEFGIKIPKRTPKSKLDEIIGSPHKKKPDLDNLLKSIIDALCPASDSHIHTIVAKKVWALNSYIEVEDYDADQVRQPDH